MTTNSENLDPAKPAHNIARINEISLGSQSFEKKFDDGSPYFTRVEFSLTELCNRQCVFCPRIDPAIYPNRDESISTELYERIMQNLANIGWQGGIAYSGFGEPLLHRDLIKLIQLTKQYLPDSILDIVSNGDQLTIEKCQELYAAGVDVLKVSLYDGPEQIPIFKKLRHDIGMDPERFIIRHRFKQDDGYGLILSNRAGQIASEDLNINEQAEPMNQACYFPFYKLMIDYDGRVLLCSHDWDKKKSAGDLNKQSIEEIWSGHFLTHIRQRLALKKRDFKPCSSCNVDGCLNGKESFDRWSNTLNTA